jgi:hypothetical protein
MGVLAHPIALDPDPVLAPTARNLLLSNDGDVILGMAGHHARSTTGALVEVDD